jgi:chromosome segregation ATPase
MKFSLQKIYMENFRAVKNSLTLDFTGLTPGLYFVQGINDAEPRLGSNGSGKSTILVDAFYWALTGKIARSQRPGELVENWSNGRELTRVVVTFKLDDVTCIIERERNPNGLYLNGEKVEQPSIDELLPLADAALRRSILIDQFGEMFLSLRPEAQSRIFSETLSLDKWIDASDRAGDEVKQNETAIQKARVILANIEGNLTEAQQSYKAARAAETAFEATQQRRITEARTQAAVAAAQAKESLAALNLAREAFAAVAGLEAKRELLELRAEQAVLIRERGRLEAKRESGQINKSRLEKRLQPYNQSTTCPECGQEVSKEHIKIKKNELLAEIKDVSDEIDDLSVDLSVTRKRTEEVVVKIGLLDEQVIEWDKARNAVDLAIQKCESDERLSARLDSAVEQIEDEQNPWTEQCNTLNKRSYKFEEDIAEYKHTLTMLDIELEVFKFWQKGFREIRLEQIDSTLIELEMATNRHAEELGLTGWEIGFNTERELKSGKVAHSFSVMLYPPQQKHAIAWEAYSGGESQRWQLATTFGLAEVLLARSGIDTDFEVLDEPTTHLSPEGIDDLLVCLSDRAKELGRKIFIIDHHSLDRGAFDGTLTVKKTVISGVTIESTIDGLVAKKERVRL